MKEKNEQKEAQKRMQDRKVKAKKKKEAKKRAEEEWLMKEKEDEVTESYLCVTSISINTNDAHMHCFDQLQREPGSSEADKSALAKAKKKWQKKLNAARAEIDDLHEEFQIEREELLDNFREANKDAELFRQICIGLLGESKLRKVRSLSQLEELILWCGCVVCSSLIRPATTRTMKNGSFPSSRRKTRVNGFQGSEVPLAMGTTREWSHAPTRQLGRSQGLGTAEGENQILTRKTKNPR